jgi:hypothetical protein
MPDARQQRRHLPRFEYATLWIDERDALVFELIAPPEII